MKRWTKRYLIWLTNTETMRFSLKKIVTMTTDGSGYARAFPACVMYAIANDQYGKLRSYIPAKCIEETDSVHAALAGLNLEQLALDMHDGIAEAPEIPREYGKVLVAFAHAWHEPEYRGRVKASHGRRIARAVESTIVTARDVARTCSIDEGNMSKWLAGDTDAVSIEKARAAYRYTREKAREEFRR